MILVITKMQLFVQHASIFVQSESSGQWPDFLRLGDFVLSGGISLRGGGGGGGHSLYLVMWYRRIVCCVGVRR